MTASTARHSARSSLRTALTHLRAARGPDSVLANDVVFVNPTGTYQGKAKARAKLEAIQTRLTWKKTERRIALLDAARVISSFGV